MDTTCRVCKSEAEADPPDRPTLWSNESWRIRHGSAPYGVAGWLTIYAREHVAGVSDLDASTAASLGRVLAWASRHLQAVTGAARIYVVSLNEQVEHLHVHLVPRAAEAGTPTGFDLFGQLGAATRGEVVVDPAAVRTVSRSFAERAASAAPD